MSLVVGWTLKENVLVKQRKIKQERLQRERYQRVYEREFREGQCDQIRQTNVTIANFSYSFDTWKVYLGFGKFLILLQHIAIGQLFIVVCK